MLLTALLFFILALAVQINVVKEFDRNIIIIVAWYRFPTLTILMKAISLLGAKYFLFPATVIVTIVLFIQRNRQFLTLPLTMLLAWFAMDGLKLFFARPRPAISALVEESGYSFPSGHTFMGALFFGFLAIFVMNRISSVQGKYLVLIVTCLFLLILGFSRLYLGVHYPTDVLAGYAGGLFFLSLARSRK